MPLLSFCSSLSEESDAVSESDHRPGLLRQFAKREDPRKLTQAAVSALLSQRFAELHRQIPMKRLRESQTEDHLPDSAWSHSPSTAVAPRVDQSSN